MSYKPTNRLKVPQISRNFTHGVGNVCKELYPSPWKQAKRTHPETHETSNRVPKSSLRREGSTEGKWNLEEESSV